MFRQGDAYVDRRCVAKHLEVLGETVEGALLVAEALPKRRDDPSEGGAGHRGAGGVKPTAAAP